VRLQALKKGIIKSGANCKPYRGKRCKLKALSEKSDEMFEEIHLEQPKIALISYYHRF
jgi:hypothetical protein